MKILRVIEAPNLGEYIPEKYKACRYAKSVFLLNYFVFCCTDGYIS